MPDKSTKRVLVCAGSMTHAFEVPAHVGGWRVHLATKGTPVDVELQVLEGGEWRRASEAASFSSEPMAHPHVEVEPLIEDRIAIWREQAPEDEEEDAIDLLCAAEAALRLLRPAAKARAAYARMPEPAPAAGDAPLAEWQGPLRDLPEPLRHEVLRYHHGGGEERDLVRLLDEEGFRAELLDDDGRPRGIELDLGSEQWVSWQAPPEPTPRKDELDWVQRADVGPGSRGWERVG